MNIIKVLVRSFLAVGVACACWLLVRTRAAEPPPGAPPFIEAGFALWAKGASIESVVNLWQKGGLLEGDSKVAGQAAYLRHAGQLAGKYLAHEVMQTKPIGRTSQVLYLQINYEKGAVYARFLLYRGEKDWVVQNMDFSTRPEALMPWLAFEGERTAP